MASLSRHASNAAEPVSPDVAPTIVTRSPHRPNSIGQTVVRYEGSSRVELPRSPTYSKPRYVHALDISGVDFVDGTPVLDIKPYVAAYDSVLSATMAPWVEQAAASDSARHGALASEVGFFVAAGFVALAISSAKR